ncbi:TonB-dependent siderophore receptor [Ectothiorhodospira sp. BSL-9]|uniref:TonB-dependent receptor plug domain-containing protein n=1 Tax=Ectothiorhodospira sp. BSL-9 TaxID=1442136 RepID=UPI0007B52E77|nr:TonB-dependent receptor plug domain-containing protein [Ectothiorhodospira sp. BSL-9]
MSDRALMMALMSSATTLSLLAVGSTASAEDSAYTLPKMTVTAATRTERRVERTPASTQVIIDGRRVAGTSGRGGELNRLPVSHIERIEIVKGPASVVYGADALAGVINIITRRPESGFEGGMEAQVGVPTHAEGGQRRHGTLYLGGGTRDTRVRLFADVMERYAYHKRATGNVDTRPPVDVAAYNFDQDHREQADVYNLRAGVNHWLTDNLQVEIEGGWMQEERQTRFLHDTPPVSTGLEESGETVKAGSFPARRSEDSGRRDLAATADWLVTDALEIRYQIYESRFKLNRSNEFLDPVGFGFAPAADSEFGLREVTFLNWIHSGVKFWG